MCVCVCVCVEGCRYGWEVTGILSSCPPPSIKISPALSSHRQGGSDAHKYHFGIRRPVSMYWTSTLNRPRPGSVVVERSPGMREVGGSIPGRVKQKTLKSEVLLLCLALSTKELETVWPAWSQNNGLG